MLAHERGPVQSEVGGFGHRGSRHDGLELLPGPDALVAPPWVPWAERVRTTWQDLIGFAPVYSGILAAGWLPALAVGNWLGRRWPAARNAWLAAAAGAGMVAAVLAVDAVAPMPSFIDATRHWPGLVTMAVGAVVGGWVYGRLTARR